MPLDELSTLHHPRPLLANEARSFQLTVLDGPDRDAAFELTPSSPGRILVGTSASCKVRLTDRKVSRRHAAFEFVGPELHLSDLTSTNGTFVNQTRILGIVLDGTTQIRLGNTLLEVRPRDEVKPVHLSEASSFARVIGGSPAMRRLYPLCERLAASNVPVLIEGETGTGKELLAEALHETGPRSAGPFVVFDCAAVAPNLIESQLFGHERGAFTGASGARRGVFEQAHGGTLFVDEIGDLDLSLQPRLLRAIERGEVSRVGSERWHAVDVRILAATRRDLDREVLDGRFREDLFYRLAVTRIELPPLRNRHGDIGRLARHFWSTLGGADIPLPYELFERYDAYAWPGNVRELKNAVLRRLALGDLADLRVEDEPENGALHEEGLDQILALDLPLPEARRRVTEALERRYLTRVLEKHGGDVGKAAAASGIARRYFNLLRARHREDSIAEC